MEQHPIPQAITTYEFRLVGEMTLKQFGKLAFGLGVAFLLYVSPLPFWLKWPLILIFASLGVALAFVPIQGRPLETWILSFIKAIYSPSEYIYQKQPELPDFLKRPVVAKPIAAPARTTPVPSQAKLKEYLGALPVQEKMTTWEQAEKRFLSQVKTAFGEIPSPTTPLAEPAHPLKKPESKPPAKAKPALTTIPTPLKKTPPLLIPDRPNIISGIIKNKQDKFVEGALIEITDREGFPVRTLKSNSLGQFKITLPLQNGTYEIQVEKEGLKFDIIKIKLEGKIIKPLEVKAK